MLMKCHTVKILIGLLLQNQSVLGLHCFSDLSILIFGYLGILIFGYFMPSRPSIRFYSSSPNGQFVRQICIHIKLSLIHVRLRKRKLVFCTSQYAKMLSKT